jgi:hypothetical protein
VVGAATESRTDAQRTGFVGAIRGYGLHLRWASTIICYSPQGRAEVCGLR